MLVRGLKHPAPSVSSAAARALLPPIRERLYSEVCRENRTLQRTQ